MTEPFAFGSIALTVVLAVIYIGRKVFKKSTCSLSGDMHIHTTNLNQSDDNLQQSAGATPTELPK